MKKHIFHLAWSPESLPTVDAISPLLDFLDTRLQDFNGRLLRGNVIRCLHIMWESVLNEIEDHVKSNASVNIVLLSNDCFNELGYILHKYRVIVRDFNLWVPCSCSLFILCGFRGIHANQGPKIGIIYSLG